MGKSVPEYSAASAPTEGERITMNMDAPDTLYATDARGSSGAGTATATTRLRQYLAFDAVVTAGNGLIYLLAAGPVGRLLDISTGLVRGVGLFLLLYGLDVGFLASRKVPSTGWTKVVIELNLAWAVLSIVALVAGWLEPSTAGLVWVPMQAAVVAGFALLQRAGLKRVLRETPA
jgi:hypothetical protein